MKKQLKLPNSNSGYVPKRPKVHQIKEEVIKAVPVKRKVTIPPDLPRALAAKNKLRQALSDYYNKHITVSINAIDGKWVLEVRGLDEHMVIPDSYNDYELIAIKSTMVKNPMSRRY